MLDKKIEFWYNILTKNEIIKEEKMERIQKKIAASGIASRRKAEELILEGRVKVNGHIIDSLGIKVGPKDEVTVDDIVVSKLSSLYLALNKPRGYISSVSDELGRKTILDLVPAELKEYKVFPVGRLDYDTKGIILLTNDGDFMNKMVGPKSGIQKEYLVRVKGIIHNDAINRLQNGVMIHGKMTLPALVFLDSIDRNNSSSLVRITITQGMNHQIKEMFKIVGYEVKRLTRVRFGNIKIDDLSEGEIRRLTIHEVKTLLELSKQSKILRIESKPKIIHI